MVCSLSEKQRQRARMTCVPAVLQAAKKKCPKCQTVRLYKFMNMTSARLSSAMVAEEETGL